MKIKDEILSEEYRYKPGSFPADITQEDRAAREAFLKKIYRKDNFISRTACPYCGSDSCVKISEVDRKALPAEIVVCGSCDGCFNLSIFTPEAQRAYYEELSYVIRSKKTTDTGRDELFFERVAKCAYPRYDFIRSYCRLEPGRDLVLECGCNDGANLVPWQKHGFRTLGIDLDDKAASFGRGKGLNILTGDLSSGIQVPEQPKLIILSHVLDQVPEVSAVLDLLVEVLHPEGYLFIESLGLRVHGIRKPRLYFDIEHTYSFDRKSLERLLGGRSLRTLYSDEYIRLICTPQPDRPKGHARARPFSIDRAIAGMLMFVIERTGLYSDNARKLLAPSSTGSLARGILNRMQLSYFTHYYKAAGSNTFK